MRNELIMTPQKLRLNLVVGTLFIVSAFLLGLDPLLSRVGFLQHLAVAQPINMGRQQVSAAEAAPLRNEPIGVYLPAINMQRSVLPGYYDAVRQTWTLSEDSAYFATTSTLPNTVSGTTFIYGHNRPAVFASLRELKVGDEAYVKVASGETFVYRLTSSQEVAPDDVWVLENTPQPTLLLQTCSGLWYQNRTMYHFKFIEVRQ